MNIQPNTQDDVWQFYIQSDIQRLLFTFIPIYISEIKYIARPKRVI